MRGRHSWPAVLLALAACAGLGGAPDSASAARARPGAGVAALHVARAVSLTTAARHGLRVRVDVGRRDRMLWLSLWQQGRALLTRQIRLKHGGVVRVRWRLRLPVPGSYVLSARTGPSRRATDARQQQARVVLTSSKPHLVALWKMDETTGSTMFDSDGDHDGTVHHVQLGFAGFSGFAYGFGGPTSKSYVSVPSAGDLSPRHSNVTLTVHLKTSGAPGRSPKDWDLIRKGTFKGGSEYTMELQHSGRASCTFRGSRGYYYQLTGGPRINDGRWHSVKCVKSPWSVGLVVDGKLFHRSRAIGAISNSAPVVIGARPAADWFFGQLDNVSIAIG